MNLLKKLMLFLLIVLVFTGNSQNAYCKTIQKDLEVETKDAHIIKATISYNKTDAVKKFPTVVLLHSLGYSSASWANLISDLNTAGFLVIAVDLRGHGKSVYNTNLQQKSWTYFTPKSYQKFPSDIVAVINQAQKQSKKVSLDNMAIIGADIGANTAILASEFFVKKPKAMVLISPSMSFKGLYVPIVLSEIGPVPILTVASMKDTYSMKEEQKIAKFAQGAFYVKNYPQGGMGMMMLKVNPSMSRDITNWLVKMMK